MTPRPAPKTFGPGSILPLAAFLLAGSTITIAALSSLGVFKPASTAAGESLTPTPAELGGALARVGITARSITAAGVQAAGAAQVVANARTHLDAQRFSALTLADDEWRTADANAERLAKLVRAGQASPEDLTALRQARTDLANAVAQRDALLADLLEAATAGLTQPQARALARIDANQAPGLDTAYLVNDRSQADTVALRDALANLKTAERVGEDPDQACSTLVTQVNAESEVAAATSHLSTRLPEVRLAFDQALEG